MSKLKDQELKNVTGGYIFHAVNITGADKDKPWELIDENGNVKERYKTRDEVIYNAGKNDLNMIELTWEQLQQLRGDNHV